MRSRRTAGILLLALLLLMTGVLAFHTNLLMGDTAPLTDEDPSFVYSELDSLQTVVSELGQGFLQVTPAQMARAAMKADAMRKAKSGDAAFLGAKIATARFHADHVLAEAPGMASSIVEGAGSVLAIPESAF